MGTSPTSLGRAPLSPFCHGPYAQERDQQDRFVKKDAELSAIHDWHLRDVLSGLGLLDRLEAGDLRCFRCQTPLTFENVGGILVGPEHTYRLVCGSITCLSQSSEAPPE